MLGTGFARLVRAGAVALGASLLVSTTATAAMAKPDPALDKALKAVHEAGMAGVYAATDHWAGAAGVADLKTKRPVRPDFEHRVGSITKTFTATAVLRQVAAGKIDLNAGVGRYLPKLVPGERGRQVTVRMLLNHTSGINDYDHVLFASVLVGSTADIERNRNVTFKPEQLARIGLAQPPTGRPGETFAYSNTNFVLAGLIVRTVTGQSAEAYITKDVIKRAGLKHTYFPDTIHINGPHSKAYELLNGRANPPGEYSDYNLSWGYTAGAIVSTMDDLNRFYRLLLTGRLLAPKQLAEMKRTVPVKDGQGNVLAGYGLGLIKLPLDPCGTVWGHNGGLFGMATEAYSTEDAHKQFALGINETSYQKLGPDGSPQPHPIDKALAAFSTTAICGKAATAPRFAPLDRLR